MRKIIFLCSILLLGIAATRPIVPRADGEGSIGVTANAWGASYFKGLYVNGNPVSTNSGGGTGNMVGSNNLSEITIPAVARTNLGLGVLATLSSVPVPVSTASNLSTILAANILTNNGRVDLTAQWASNKVSVLETNTATKAQGTLAASALQSGASYTNITGLGTASTNNSGDFLASSYPVVTNNQPVISGVTMANVVTNLGSGYGLGQIYNNDGTNLSGNMYAEKDWVRGLFSGGSFFYATTNLSAGNTNYYTFTSEKPVAYATRVYNAVTQDQYIGSVMTTQLFTTVNSPISVDAWLGYNVGAGKNASLHPEIYYTYDNGTNLLGDYETADQTMPAIAGSNLMSFTVSFPTINSTNTTGFRIVRRFKMGAVSTGGNAPNVTFYITTNANPSHISLPSPQFDTSLGVRGATGLVYNVTQSASYDISGRVLTIPDTLITNNGSATLSSLGLGTSLILTNNSIGGTQALTCISYGTNWNILFTTNSL